MMRLMAHGLCRLSLTFILSIGYSQPAFGGVRPRFNLDYSSWHATDIVLVSTTPAKSVFEVVETWKGNMRSGDLLTVPGLEPAANSAPISHYPKQEDLSYSEANEIRTQIPKQVVGSRLILFLKRLRVRATSSPSQGTPELSEWQPSDILHDMKASAVWIDSGKLYWFQQVVNPGPSILLPSDMSESKMRGRVAEIDHVQQDLTTILKEQNGGVRAEHLKPYLRSKVYPVQRFALEELGKCGPSAVAAIHGMLDDPAFADEAPELIKAYSEAGGETVAKDLTLRLERELKFWQATGPMLPMGWWNQHPEPHASLRGHYVQTLELIHGLMHTHDTGALSTVIQLRDLWRSYPQLNDPSGLNQMAEECDRTIVHLQEN